MPPKRKSNAEEQPPTRRSARVAARQPEDAIRQQATDTSRLTPVSATSSTRSKREAADEGHVPKKRKSLKPSAPSREAKGKRPKKPPGGVEPSSRIQRAKQHRLFLVGRRDSAQDLADDALVFVVMGTTGNIYYPTLSAHRTIRCTCFDQRVRKGFCKHLLFVLLRVLRVPESHPVMERKHADLSASEMSEIYAMSRDRIPEISAIAPGHVQNAFTLATGQPVSLEEAQAKTVAQRSAEGDDCPICFEEMHENEEDLVYCKLSCGRSVHSMCFANWAASKRKAGEVVTCVYCRQPWVSEVVAQDRKFHRKRLNLESFVE
uniref:Uncharacterized protein n=1 Tax=Spongospora subterranea TaxID=70186 RepID=A0A0H5R8G2_9EUKA|eukprot:CRZ10002.1 hypothetical protein [Spongospora subterranea]